ncbi:MAG: hypothetical protein JO002_02585 [Burkholderiaceae bacterium]|nr:hypothetical protein [Burkholderiaceae bacterium]
MLDIPSHADLLAAVDQPCQLIGESGASCQVELIGAPTFDALDDSYVCYAAIVRLESGLDALQANYHFKLPDGRQWQLLFTPGRPDVDGRRIMSAVIHVRSDTFAMPS